jgi:hypothetical protein
MTPLKARAILIFAPLLVALAGCNLPINTSTATQTFPTPNLTMTAIFDQPVNVSVPPTVTPGPMETPTGEKVVIPTQGGSLPTATQQAPIFPTATQSPSAAPTSSAAKPGTAAVFLSTAPKIDGAWDEWKTTQYPLRSVVFGAKNWKNSDDLEAAYRIGWDDTNLYLAVKVTDNVYVQNATGENIYKGDSLDLLIDTDPNASSSAAGLTNNDYQLGISPGNPEVGKNPEAYLWFPSSKTGSQSKVQIAAIKMTGGYRVEAAIPWSVLGVTPSDGQQLGFALSVSDNDQTGKTIQEKMISSAPNRKLVDPTTWGVLTLKK